jgi:cytochrome c oxidase cbb3-type subunit 3
MRLKVFLSALVLACLALQISYPVSAESGPDQSADPVLIEEGRIIYEFYCYQCHGYSGEAETLAALNMRPRPRNFAATALDGVSVERMRESVSRGRPGTAMVSFQATIGSHGVKAVVAYVRGQLMDRVDPRGRYHTKENGWPDHDRYIDAFPFVTGQLSTRPDIEALSASQHRGYRLYMWSCVTCHDSHDEEPLKWDPRATSYPRRHFGPASGYDAVTRATPYSAHNLAPKFDDLTEPQQRGEALYAENCAFCHAGDGTGKNWIGQFLQPHPRDLTLPGFLSALPDEMLAERIRQGSANTSMPAWKDVLTDGQISDLMQYLRRAFDQSVSDEPR